MKSEELSDFAAQGAREASSDIAGDVNFLVGVLTRATPESAPFPIVLAKLRWTADRSTDNAACFCCNLGASFRFCRRASLKRVNQFSGPLFGSLVGAAENPC